MENIETMALANQRRAWQIIEKSGIREAWGSIGAKVCLVGSLSMGLLMKHRDIDFHIYTETLETATAFKVMEKICSDPAVTRMEYRNLGNTDEACLEWHVWYMFENEEWQIDMIQILKNSAWDGFFENVAARINAVLTPEMRRTILELKYQTPENEHIMGIEYYQAVIAGGVRSYDAFMAWRKDHPASGIVEWCP